MVERGKQGFLPGETPVQMPSGFSAVSSLHSSEHLSLPSRLEIRRVFVDESDQLKEESPQIVEINLSWRVHHKYVLSGPKSSIPDPTALADNKGYPDS
jgi:PII-like signaling protein